MSFASKEEIKEIFQKKIRPRMAGLERARFRARNNLVFFLILLSGSLIWLIQKMGMFYFQKFGPVLICTAATLAYGISKFITWKYVSKFKREVIKEIFSALLKESEYRPRDHVSKNTFDDSYVLGSNYDEFYGEDYVSGLINDIRVEFSEVKAIKVNYGSKRKKNKTVVYQGLFFAFSLNQNFRHNTLILHDQAERVMGAPVGRFFQKHSSREGYELVSLESIEFEKEYVVYSNDQIQSRVLLKPIVLENLVRFKRKYKKNVDISIRENKLYLGVQGLKNYFEPGIWSESIKFQDVREIYDLMSLAHELQSELKLTKAS